MGIIRRRCALPASSQINFCPFPSAWGTAGTRRDPSEPCAQQTCSAESRAVSGEGTQPFPPKTQPAPCSAPCSAPGADPRLGPISSSQSLHKNLVRAQCSWEETQSPGVVWDGRDLKSHPSPTAMAAASHIALLYSPLELSSDL